MVWTGIFAPEPPLGKEWKCPCHSLCTNSKQKQGSLHCSPKCTPLLFILPAFKEVLAAMQATGTCTSHLPPNKSRINSLGQGTDTVLGRTNRSCNATAVCSQLPHCQVSWTLCCPQPPLGGPEEPVRLVQSPALLHRIALNPHKVSGAEKHGRARRLPPYGLPEEPALNLWRS